jgi:hypothetical protein
VPTVGAFIQNPRQFPRIQARYRVVVSHAGAGWSAETFDLSATGCQIISPRPMQKGEVAKLVIEAPQLSQPLSVFGSVAWTADKGRIRVGLAFSDRQPDGDPSAWFKRLVANQPGIEGTMRRVPERLPADTKLFLRPPPRFIFDFGPDEVTLLKMLGDGTTIANVLRKGPFSPVQAARLVFALLEQRVITLSLGEASPAWRWKAALADFESQAGERQLPSPVAPRPAASAPPPMADRSSPSRSPPGARPAPAPAARPDPAPVAPPDLAPVPAPAPEAAAPTRPATDRGPEAQECFDLAVSAVSMGEISTAIGLLRRGLQLSPRDPEISALLGQLAFRDRQVGQR